MSDRTDIVVVIPTYQRVSTIRRAIDSVLGQDYDRCRLVVIDDGSTDGTSQVLDAVHDERFVHTYQENHGRCAARNAGAASSDESWLLFLDSDDELLPGTLEHIDRLLQNAECDLVVGSASAIDERGIARHRGPSWNAELELPWAMSAGSFAIRRELFDAVGGYCEELTHSEHTEMVYSMRSLPSKPVVATTDRALARVFLRSDRYDPDVQLRTAEHLLEHIARELSEDREARSMFRGIAGVNALKLGHVRPARRHLFGAFTDRPRPRSALRLAAVVLPARIRGAVLGSRSDTGTWQTTASTAIGAGPATVSVVIPAHDADATIEAQITALRSQDSPILQEVIVVDSASTDGTASLVARLEDDWTKLRLVTAARHGANAARNFGASQATGDAVLLCDADDVVGSDWIEVMHDALQSHDVVRGRYSLSRLNDPPTIAARGSIESMQPPRDGELFGGLGGNCGFRRRAWAQLGGLREHHYGCDDAEFFWRAHQAGLVVGHVEAAVVHYRLRADMASLFRQQRSWASGRALLYKEFGRSGLIERRTLTSAAKVWVWLGVHLPDRWSKDPACRGGWVRSAAGAVGRLEGSLRHRVVFP